MKLRKPAMFEMTVFWRGGGDLPKHERPNRLPSPYLMTKPPKKDKEKDKDKREQTYLQLVCLPSPGNLPKAISSEAVYFPSARHDSHTTFALSNFRLYTPSAFMKAIPRVYPVRTRSSEAVDHCSSEMLRIMRPWGDRIRTASLGDTGSQRETTPSRSISQKWFDTKVIEGSSFATMLSKTRKVRLLCFQAKEVSIPSAD